MMKNLFFRLGSHPHLSWARFKKGLGLFVAGVVLLYAGAIYWIWLQIPAVFLLGLGFALAAYGYLGIFANRFSQTLNDLNARGKRAGQNTLPK